MRSKAYKALSSKTLISLKKVGENLRLARKRRKMSMQDLAERISTSYQTVSRMESGDPKVGIGIIAAALDIFGLDWQVREIATPEKDELGVTLEHERTLGRRKATTGDFDF